MRKCWCCGKEYEPKCKTQGLCSDDCRKKLRNAPEYKKNRAKALLRDGGCVECGATTNLQCHHKVMISCGGTHRLSNLEMRCKAHHMAIHRMMRLEGTENGNGRRRESKELSNVS